MNPDSSQPKPSGRVARDQRRAAALRENLRRRKSQARARAAQGTETAEVAGTAKTAGTRPMAQVPDRETEP